MNRKVLLVVVAALLSNSTFLCAIEPMPEYWPTCPSPRPIAPMQALGAMTWSGVAVACNGVEYGVAYCDSADDHFYFQRFFADGTAVAPRVQVSALTNSGMDGRTGMHAGGLVWNGSSYALAFSAKAPSGLYQIYFATITIAPSGTATVSAPLKVSHVPATEGCDAADAVLAWSGNGYSVVWCDYSSGYIGDIFGTLLDAGGNLSGALGDIPLSYSSGASRWPAIAYLSGYSYYAVVWVVGALPSQIYYSSLGLDGTTISPVNLVPASGNCWSPSLAGFGNGFGMAWADGRDAGMNGEIYFALFDIGGGHLTSDARLSANANGYTGSPCAVWTGAEYDVFYSDAPVDSGPLSGEDQVWQRSVTASGTPTGVSSLVTASVGFFVPSAALARYGFLVGLLGTTVGVQTHAMYIQAVGCADDATPPTCPGNFLAYNVTGTSAMLYWSPSGEDLTDLAYYRVYRNNALVATTDNTFYADSGLTLDTSYNYMIQPVNGAQSQNYACTSSLNIRTNATLTLRIDKEAPDAQLWWNAIDPINYNVFRGTSPQIMSQIGSTGGCQFDDPNVLTDNVLYFYSVDEPGR